MNLLQLVQIGLVNSIIFTGIFAATMVDSLEDRFSQLNLSKLLQEGAEKVRHFNDEQVVFVLGNTGSGKSSTIAYLMGAPIVKRRQGVKTYVEIDSNPNPSPYPKIGQTLEAETLYPHLYMAEGILFGDCPGFLDTRSNARIAISVTLERALKAARSRKILILSSIKSLQTMEGRAETLKSLMGTVNNLFVDPQEVGRFVLWGFTTDEEGYVSQDIIDTLKGRELSEDSGSLRRYLIDRFNTITTAASLSAINREGDIVKDAVKIFKRAAKSHRINKAKKEELEGYMRQLTFLEFITNENILIINPLDRENRARIIEKLSHTAPISIQQFKFDEDEPRQAFKTFCYKYAERALEQFKQRDDLRFLLHESAFLLEEEWLPYQCYTEEDNEGTFCDQTGVNEHISRIWRDVEEEIMVTEGIINSDKKTYKAIYDLAADLPFVFESSLMQKFLQLDIFTNDSL